jgi:hypothetical protein
VADRDERADGGSRSRRLAVVASIALVAPLVALPFGGRALADFIARTAGEGLAAALPDPEPMEPGADGEAGTESAPLLEEEIGTVDGAPRAPADARPRSPSIEARSSRRGLLIRADLVARAVKSGVRPSAVPAPASGMRPDGLALYGVGGFGAGLRDGDVVTSIAGSPASSVGAVIGAISSAVHARAKSISAVVWRGDKKLLVTVEIPPIAKLGRKASIRP